MLPLEDEYYRYWLHSGQRVTVSVDANSRENNIQTTKSVTLIGLTRDGFLLAKDDIGNEVELHPDGNR